MTSPQSRHLPALDLAPQAPTLEEVPSPAPARAERPGLMARQKTLLGFAAGVVLLFPLDLMLQVTRLQASFLARLAWAGGLTAAALVPEPFYARHRRLVSAVESACSGALFLGLVSVTGGATSPYFPITPLMPLVVAMATRIEAAAIANGLVIMLGTVGLMVSGGQSPSEAVGWGTIIAALTFFGVYGSHQSLKGQLAESQARLERTRREAVEQLALSERRRTQSEKLALIGKLAASVAHEINNPLAYLGSNLNFLQQELARPAEQVSREEVSEVLAEMRTGLERIRQIAADLKGFSRMDMDEASECSLKDVVADAARLASLKLKHVARLEVSLPAELPPVLAVRRRLTQVLLNLLVNAGEALEEAQQRDAQVWVSGRVEGSHVVLLVEDNGPGFPAEVLTRLFEAFFTTKAADRGTGLGLALSREFVEQVGGSLHASNRPEGGARLRLELPLAPSEEPLRATSGHP